MTSVITGAAAPQQAAPTTTPAPVYHDDLPIMREPPPTYAPPVKGEGINKSQRITPLRQLRKEEGPEPDWVKCPLCNKVTTIRRVSEPSDEANIPPDGEVEIVRVSNRPPLPTAK
ncbi:hypothetical protein EKO27_g659 [Xylaria grammica]|uniref:Uncharacterized protein n=1 Tax=Xylaria grammica TaxID=363999 RepID=A0A439DJ76_9PEZI|nr:hypothetical protein EKO27_g659 [Xylaria grammica]